MSHNIHVHNIQYAWKTSQIHAYIIYFLSFERSKLEGKYSLIVSVYACMHYVWEIVVCCHSGDAGLFAYNVCCMHGQFGSAGGYLKWML